MVVHPEACLDSEVRVVSQVAVAFSLGLAVMVGKEDMEATVVTVELVTVYVNCCAA